MILFHHVVEILELADGDRGAVLRIRALNGGGIGLTPIDRGFLRHAMPADRPGQEQLGRWLVVFPVSGGTRP